jgi:hypothetical protein
MAPPPFELGADHVRATEALPATAVTKVGAPGTVTRAGRAESAPEALSGALLPVGDVALAFDDTAIGIIESSNTAAPDALVTTTRISRR